MVPIGSRKVGNMDHIPVSRWVWNVHVERTRAAYLQDCIDSRPDCKITLKLQRDIGYIAEMRLLQAYLPLLHSLTRIETTIARGLCSSKQK